MRAKNGRLPERVSTYFIIEYYFAGPQHGALHGLGSPSKLTIKPEQENEFKNQTLEEAIVWHFQDDFLIECMSENRKLELNIPESIEDVIYVLGLKTTQTTFWNYV